MTYPELITKQRLPSGRGITSLQPDIASMLIRIRKYPEISLLFEQTVGDGILDDMQSLIRIQLPTMSTSFAIVYDLRVAVSCS